MPSVRSSPRGYGRTRARNPLYRDCGEGRPKLITDLGPLLEEGDKSILPADPCPARDRLERKSSGRRRFQRPSKHVTERLGPPAAKALDVAGHNVEHTRGEARLDADDDVDGPCRQTRLRQSGAQLLFRDDMEREWLASDIRYEARAFRTRQALGACRVVNRACMAIADQDSGCGGRHVIARNESSPVLGQPGQHALA